MQHGFAARPWAKVGADLCDHSGQILLVISDYYSNFIEVEHLNKATTSTVSKALKSMFARYGVPDVLISDNGPQFASEEFAGLAQKWGFEHITSSPHYPQSNGKAENAVKTVKRLFSNCKERNCSEFMALLDWRNTPTEGLGSSPAQRLLGRRCRTLLPTHWKLLTPGYPTEGSAKKINHQKERQRYYYDLHTKPLNLLVPGDSIRMRLPGEKRWSPGVCAGLVNPRSYEVKVGDRTFVRNRQHLIKSEDKFVEDTQEVEETHDNSSKTPPTEEPPQEASLLLQSGPATALMSTPVKQTGAQDEEYPSLHRRNHENQAEVLKENALIIWVIWYTTNTLVNVQMYCLLYILSSIFCFRCLY